jgi:PAS domain S-box-containing protein
LPCGSESTPSLTSRERNLAIAAVVFAMVALGALDFALHSVQLRPLSIVFVIAITALAGYRWGIASGIFAALFFTTIEAYSGFRWQPAALAWNAALAALGLIVAVALVEALRSRIEHQRAADTVLHDTHQELRSLQHSEAAATALRRAEQRYKAVGESLPFGVWQTNTRGDELLYVSQSYCDMLGMTREQISAGGWNDRVPEEDRERFQTAWNVREQKDVFEGEYRIRGKDGKIYWILSRGTRLTDDDGETTGWAGFNLDITQRKQAEGRFAFLADLGRTLASSLEPAIVLEKTAHIIVPRFADWCTIDIAKDDGEIERLYMVHRDPELDQAFKTLLPDPREAALFGYRTTQVIATGRPDWQRSPSGMAKSAEQLDLLKRLGLGSLIAVPLEARGQMIGAITFVSASDQTYEPDDVGFVSIMARRIALAYDNARLYAREHRVADTFQRASLPAVLPEVPGMEIRAHYQPGAKEAEIGGDWYDAFQLSDGRVALSIGDVAGKGLQAASIMSTLRLLIRASALEGLSPARVLARANQLLLNDRPAMATAVFGILDPEELTYTCSIAGHPLPLVISRDGEVTQPRPISPPLGVVANTLFPEQTIMVPLGSMLVLYTDGLIEDSRGALNGEEQLMLAVSQTLQTGQSNAATAIAQLILSGAPKDDVAVLTVTTSARPLLELDLTLPAAPTSSRLFRQALRRFYLAAGLGSEKIDLLQVAVGEAIMNSIEHAYGVKGGNVRVRAWVEGGKLIIDVSDRGRWRAPHDDGGGYGLRVLKGIVQHVDVNRTESGTIVRLTQPVGRAIT